MFPMFAVTGTWRRDTGRLVERIAKVMAMRRRLAGAILFVSNNRPTGVRVEAAQAAQSTVARAQARLRSWWA